MNLDEFRAVVDDFGADPDRWPTDVRAEAESFAASSREAGEILAREAEFDALFRTGPTEASENLRARILTIPGSTRQKRRRGKPLLGLPLGFLAPRLAGVVAAGLIGFLLGFNGLLAGLYPGAESSEPVDLSAMVYGLDMEEVSP